MVNPFDYVSPLGEILYAIYVAVILLVAGIATYLLRKRQSKSKYFLVSMPTLILLAAPLYDVTLTAIDMKYYCENEHGVHIYKSVTVDGYISDYFADSGILRLGYKFVENEEYNGKIERYTKTQSGIIKEVVYQPVSEYGLYTEKHILKSNIKLNTLIIKKLKTQEILGTHRKYWAGMGILDRLAHRYFDSIGFSCKKINSDFSNVTKFLLAVLKPKEQS